jgi:hypothetical protein
LKNKINLSFVKDDSPFTYQPRTRANRLDKIELTYARNYRLKEIQMWKIIKEVLTYLCFLSMLYAVIYSNVHQNAFLEVNHLRKFFLNTRSIDQDYTKVRLFFSLDKI